MKIVNENGSYSVSDEFVKQSKSEAEFMSALKESEIPEKILRDIWRFFHKKEKGKKKVK